MREARFLALTVLLVGAGACGRHALFAERSDGGGGVALGLAGAGGTLRRPGTGGSMPVGGVGGNLGVAGGTGGSWGTGGSVGKSGGVTSTLPAGTGGISLGANCGNSVIERIEQCDDGNTQTGDGCTRLCQVENGWYCPDPGRPCQRLTVCGDQRRTAGEDCDDGNTTEGDGCADDCGSVEAGFTCPVPGRPCVPLCGDGKVIAPETCDDGNTNDGDGCSGGCRREPGCQPSDPNCSLATCGDGMVEGGEECDVGEQNGFFHGDGTGCSLRCTREPSCRDSAGRNQACTAVCGDGRVETGETCDDGNRKNGDGCSTTCTLEPGFACTTSILPDAVPCRSGDGLCRDLWFTYRDFLPENVAGGHPDFYWLGTRSGDQITTYCVPNSAGPSKSMDATERCWDIAAADLVNGKPVYNRARPDIFCPCQFTDWNLSNASHIAGGYAKTESPLYDPRFDDFRYDAQQTTSAGDPIWHGQVPVVTSADSFAQWWQEDATVNRTFAGALELSSASASDSYRYDARLLGMSGGFYPLDALNPGQKTLCNMMPYWHAWPTCAGEQYLFPPRLTAADCSGDALLEDGCWVKDLVGQLHDNYFTGEARSHFVYDGSRGFSLLIAGTDDIFVFINGKLVIDLGGVHQAIPGQVTVSGNPGKATITEGGCLDAAGNITQYCNLVDASPKQPAQPDDYRNRSVALGLQTGRTYELAIFLANRHATDSSLQITLSGLTVLHTACVASTCGDGLLGTDEQCDLGAANDTGTYGGCTSLCRLGPHCGDGILQGDEECDLGLRNGDLSFGISACTRGCRRPHFCGDAMVDVTLGEECDLGTNNGLPGQPCTILCQILM